MTLQEIQHKVSHTERNGLLIRWPEVRILSGTPVTGIDERIKPIKNQSQQNKSGIHLNIACFVICALKGSN